MAKCPVSELDFPLTSIPGTFVGASKAAVPASIPRTAETLDPAANTAAGNRKPARCRARISKLLLTKQSDIGIATRRVRALKFKYAAYTKSDVASGECVLLVTWFLRP